jgi:hypothetical protein
MDAFDPRKWSVPGCCAHSNEPLPYMKGEEVIEQLSDYQLLCSTELLSLRRILINYTHKNLTAQWYKLKSNI